MPRSSVKPDSNNSFIDHLYVLILAGGGGTRLWPLSRDSSPKQFLSLFEGKSLFQLTLERARKLTSPDKIFISTNQKYVAHITKQAKGVPAENIIGEPMRRDTALAQGLGALYIYKNDPDAVIVNLASDHLIKPVSIFVNNMHKAAQIAYEKSEFVTIGIRPRFPHTGMGHIKTVQGQGVKFIEKPPLAQAKKYTFNKGYYWNANLYVWRAKLILDLLKKYAPKTYAQFPRLEKAIGTGSEKSAIQTVFQMAPTVSIDIAVSEKLRKFVCVPASFHWTDVGDWSEVKNNLPNDELGNAVLGTAGKGKYIGLDSKNNLLVLDKQLIATVGVENLLIIDTSDAILVCNIADDQAVKQIHKMIGEQGLTKYL